MYIIHLFKGYTLFKSYKILALSIFCAMQYTLVAYILYIEQFAAFNCTPIGPLSISCSPLVTTSWFSVSISLFLFIKFTHLDFLDRGDIIQYLTLSDLFY